LPAPILVRSSIGGNLADSGEDSPPRDASWRDFPNRRSIVGKQIRSDIERYQFGDTRILAIRPPTVILFTVINALLTGGLAVLPASKHRTPNLLRLLRAAISAKERSFRKLRRSQTPTRFQIVERARRIAESLRVVAGQVCDWAIPCGPSRRLLPELRRCLLATNPQKKLTRA
jgi:hypothetical protein